MKNILIFLFLVSFSMNAISQDKYPELQVIDNLSKFNKSLTNKYEKNAAKKQDFFFSINPYLWTIAVGGKVGVPGIPSQYPQIFEFNKSFSDAIKNLKMAFMVGGKFKYKSVGLLYDIAYVNLKNFGATLPDGLGLVSANTTNKELIVDLALAYSVPSRSKTTFLDVYAGTRIWSLESELTLVDNLNRSTMRSVEKTWVDPILGINANFILSNKWFSYFKSDIGGFGVNSHFTWMVLGGAGYNLSKNFNTSLGIKYLGINFDRDATVWKVNQYGFVLSLGYRYL